MYYEWIHNRWIRFFLFSFELRAFEPEYQLLILCFLIRETHSYNYSTLIKPEREKEGERERESHAYVCWGKCKRIRLYYTLRYAHESNAKSPNKKTAQINGDFISNDNIINEQKENTHSHTHTDSGRERGDADTYKYRSNVPCYHSFARIFTNCK